MQSNIGFTFLITCLFCYLCLVTCHSIGALDASVTKTNYLCVCKHTWQNKLFLFLIIIVHNLFVHGSWIPELFFCFVLFFINIFASALGCVSQNQLWSHVPPLPIEFIGTNDHS